MILLAIAAATAVALAFRARQRARAGLIEPDVELVPSTTIANGVGWLLVGLGSLLLVIMVMVARS